MFGLNVAAEDAPLIFYMNCYRWPSLCVEQEKSAAWLLFGLTNYS